MRLSVITSFQTNDRHYRRPPAMLLLIVSCSITYFHSIVRTPRLVLEYFLFLCVLVQRKRSGFFSDRLHFDLVVRRFVVSATDSQVRSTTDSIRSYTCLCPISGRMHNGFPPLTADADPVERRRVPLCTALGPNRNGIRLARIIHKRIDFNVIYTNVAIALAEQ